MASKKAWTISIAASVLLVVVVLGGLFASGYRFFVVQTPSMATTAPVGTVVVVHPETSYAVGDIISFTRGNYTYTHRIVDQTTQGWVTKGDLNASRDPLTVSESQIVGKVVLRAKYLGFLINALPWLLIGGAVVYVLTLMKRVRPSWRWQIRLVGWSLVASLVALWQRPWVNMVMIGYVADSGTGVDMHLVNTGIFPVKVLDVVLSSGQDAVVNQRVIDAAGRYTVTPQLALNFWWFLALVVICLTPLIFSLLVKVADPIEDAEEPAPEPAPVPVRPSIPRLVFTSAYAPILIVVAAIVAVTLILQAGTQATYSSVIKNTNDVAATRTFFSCKNAVSSLGTSGTYLAWALDSARGTGSNETDLSGNGRSGRYSTTATTYTSSVGCNNQDSPKAAVNFDGNKCLYVNSNYSAITPQTFSLEAWFRTGKVSNGKIIGFGTVRNGVGDNNWDRHIYLDRDGRIVFGVYPGVVRLVYTRAGVNYADNQWHHVVATLSSAGQSLYVDGTLAMTNPAVTSAEGVAGYWKVGCGNLDNWQNAATAASGSGSLDYSGPKYFTGQIQYAAVYTAVLSATQVKEHYLAGAA